MSLDSKRLADDDVDYHHYGTKRSRLDAAEKPAPPTTSSVSNSQPVSHPLSGIPPRFRPLFQFPKPELDLPSSFHERISESDVSDILRLLHTLDPLTVYAIQIPNWTGHLPLLDLSTIGEALLQDLKGFFHRFSNLLEIDLSCRALRPNEIDKLGADTFAGHPFACLSTLRFSGERIDVHFVQNLIQSLNHLTKLVTVEFKDCGLRDAGVRALNPFLARQSMFLKHLTLSGSFMGQIGAIDLNKLLLTLSLTSLDLSNNNFKITTIISGLQAQRQLETFNFSRNKFVFDWERRDLNSALLSLSMLKHLNLSECSLGEDGFSALRTGLRNARHLQTLNLALNGLRGTSGLILQDVFKRTTKLISLNLGHNLGGDEVVDACYESLSGLQQLEELKLHGCGLSRASLRSLSKALEKVNRIKFLDLSMNKFGSWGMAVILPGLMNQLRLESLLLSGCQLDDEAVSYLASFLIVNRSLVKLDLSLNGIGDIGLSSMLYGLTRQQNLMVLNLLRNNIGRSGIQSLNTLLLSINQLRFLDIRSNIYNDFNLTQLVPGLSNQSFLVELYLLCNLDRLALAKLSHCVMLHLPELRLIEFSTTAFRILEDGYAAITSARCPLVKYRVMNLDSRFSRLRYAGTSLLDL